MTTATTRLTATAAVLCLVAVACSSDGDDITSPSTPDTPAVLAAPQPVSVSPGAGQVTDERLLADSELSMPAYFNQVIVDVTFADGLELPAVTTGYWYPPGFEPAEADVAAVAAAFGVTDSPIAGTDWTSWQAGPTDGSTPSVTFSSDPSGSWWYSGAWAQTADIGACATTSPDAVEAVETPAPAEDLSAESTIVGDEPLQVDPTLGCEAQAPPVGVPTEQQAQQLASDLLIGLGEDPDNFEFQVYADEYFANVTASELLDGVPSSLAWTFSWTGVDGEAALTYAGGHLATPTAAGPYELISLEQAAERVIAYNSGGYTIEPAGEAASSDEAVSSEGSDAAVSEPIAIDEPVEPAEPVEVVAEMVSARASWWMSGDAEEMWLTPAWTFVDTDGREYLIPAIADQYLIVDESAVDAGEPGLVVDGETGEDVSTLEVEALVGSTLNDFVTGATAAGFGVRVVILDGEPVAATADYVSNRANVVVENDIVVRIENFG